MRDWELQHFYAVSADFRHSKADRIKTPVVKVRFTPPFQPMAATVCLSNGQLNKIGRTPPAIS